MVEYTGSSANVNQVVECRHCEERGDEALQSNGATMDCFACGAQ